MLIDGPSLVYRGYFALPPLTMSDGTLVNAVFGFLQIVLRGMQDVKPDYAILSFDLGKPQFRFDAYPEYKAGRPSMPDDLRAQFPIVRELAQMMGMPIRELQGYEADDVIGSLTKRATAEGVDTMIVSGDLDGLQLVDDHVRLLTTRMGVAATVIYDEARVMERYGLRPDQMLDYKALKGDTSDNIPGVPGVGEKTASSLLQQFGTLDAIYEHLDEVKGKMRDRLAEHRASAFMSREIGRIVTDLPVELGLDEARTGRYDRRAVAQRFRELEFRSLIDRLPASSIAPTGYDSPEQATTGRASAQPRPARWRGSRRLAPRTVRHRAAGPTRSPIPPAPSSMSTRAWSATRRRWGSSTPGSRRTATTSASAGSSAPGARSSGGSSGSRSRAPTAAPGTSRATRAASPSSGCRTGSPAPTAGASVTT